MLRCAQSPRVNVLPYTPPFVDFRAPRLWIFLSSLQEAFLQQPARETRGLGPKIEQPIYQSCRMEHIAEDVVIMGFCKMGIDPGGLQKKLDVADLIRW